MQRHRQCDAETQFKIAAGSDKGGDPSGKLCRLMPSVNKIAVRFIEPEAAAAFLHQILRMSVRKQAVQPEVAQQADNKHSVAQYGRHSLGIKRGGQHLHQRDEQHDPCGETQRKSQHAVRRFWPRTPRNAPIKVAAPASKVRISGTDIHYSLSICRPNLTFKITDDLHHSYLSSSSVKKAYGDVNKMSFL